MGTATLGFVAVVFVAVLVGVVTVGVVRFLVGSLGRGRDDSTSQVSVSEEDPWR